MARRATIGMKIVAPTSARTAHRVIAISESAKRDLVERIHLDPARIDVTHLGIRVEEHPSATPEADLRARFDLGDGPLVLCVAQKREHKNLARLVRAVASLSDPSVRLLLPGSPTPHEEELRQIASQLGAAERLKTPGWVSAEDLEGLYRAASCFVLPSFEEGFGLPLLEAMARGAPVACSNVSSLPEVAGEAALYFDPTREDEIAAAIRRLIEDRDLAVRLAAKGRERCAEFTWEATARQTLATYRRAIEERGRGRYRRR
jgi:glycosyltransferase involved in cell wall biosynthesis